ncbi:MAG: alanine dehydrogenase [Methanobacteriaceae archaeon]|jgi:alanine dehydrogenase|nr:MAG: alanine dehydrogenase [Methanobacterium sp. BRmetb2]MCC7557166.1 alanine dehydrogenase [Methanobacteriaceae archaeon]
MPATIVLKQSEIKKMAKMDEIIESVETGYLEHARRRVQMPAKKYLYYRKHNGDLRIMPCYLRNMDQSGVKNVNVHPDNPQNHGLPTVMGLIELVEPKTGFPVALMDGTWITNMRTGAAGGIATKYLARDNSETIGLVGAGKQAETQIMALNEVMDIKNAKVFCRTCASRTRFAKMISEKFGFPVKAVDSAKEAVTNVDVVVTSTPVKVPVIKSKWIREGTHINAMGADAPEKQELETSLTLRSKVVIDCWEQASHSGEINIPVSTGQIKREDIQARIGDVIAGKSPGRQSDEEITIFDSTGLAVQDITTAWMIYEKALKEGKGQKINFLD